MRRRDFVKSAPIGIMMGLSGCINPSDKNESTYQGPEPPESKISLGRSDQVELLELNPDDSYSEVDVNLYRYENSVYTDSELATLVASRILKSRIESILRNNRVLREDGISVSVDDVDIQKASNTELRREFNLKRSGKSTVVVNYDIRKQNDSLKSPDTSFEKIVDITPHSGSVEVQFEFGRNIIVLPVVVRRNIY